MTEYWNTDPTKPPADSFGRTQAIYEGSAGDPRNPRPVADADEAVRSDAHSVLTALWGVETDENRDAATDAVNALAAANLLAATPGEGAALVAEFTERLFGLEVRANTLGEDQAIRGDDARTVVQWLAERFAARAGAADPLRQAVEALLKRAEEGADAWGACSHEWLRIADLRSVLDDSGHEAGS